ncbi:hypothetical protein [Candidatus Venteria ishoeyi]|uniref:Uncharacterized protein n=1 Tax=Candidatus Venteria ishoeyi TaxID=1899563 RepID=A0A1H6F2A9_9GAMM|nr:hypothetical protein [Candidatus Venteria ishoeyi]SEH04288.1 Uncharacterised protein [Candidatus Venteria ishoeyi]
MHYNANFYRKFERTETHQINPSTVGWVKVHYNANFYRKFERTETHQINPSTVGWVKVHYNANFYRKFERTETHQINPNRRMGRGALQCLIFIVNLNAPKPIKSTQTVGWVEVHYNANFYRKFECTETHQINPNRRMGRGALQCLIFIVNLNAPKPIKST